MNIQMLIGGDSAGGNLCFGLISHLIKPHAEIPPLDLAEPLRGALLVSPWVSFQTNAPSFKRNMGLDSIDRKFLERAEKAFLGNAKVDEYNQPLTARSEWWKELHCAVSKTFFVAGELEIFVDDIAALSKKVSCNNDGVQIMVIPGETHDQMFIDPMIGYGLDGVSARTVQKWIEIRLAHTKRE
ncbi:MAG: hypothetical protein LQ342_006582 [Letrouitia transgressa]|nr:MAG: hypothetical protein LQ342_006582 [Letrouitia transgressa]